MNPGLIVNNFQKILSHQKLVSYFSCCLNLLFIFPNISNGISVMKVANNCTKLLSNDTNYAAYFIGFL